MFKLKMYITETKLCHPNFVQMQMSSGPMDLFLPSLKMFVVNSVLLHRTNYTVIIYRSEPLKLEGSCCVSWSVILAGHESHLAPV